MVHTETLSTKWKSDRVTLETSLIFSIGQQRVLDSRTKKSANQPQQSEPFPAVIDQQTGITEDETREMVGSNQQVDGWISRIREQLYLEPSVESVYMSIEEANIDFWVVIPKWDIDVVHHIAESQARIMDMFGQTEKPLFFIDFHVIYRNGHDESELIPTLAIRLPKQA